MSLETLTEELTEGNLADYYRLEERYSNYCQEQVAIQRKLRNPNVPRNKKEKLVYRFKLLTEKLIPQTVIMMQGKLPDSPDDGRYC